MLIDLTLQSLIKRQTISETSVSYPSLTEKTSLHLIVVKKLRFFVQ